MNLKYTPMKALNAQASATLKKIVSKLENDYVKIDNTNGSFMALSAEIIFENETHMTILRHPRGWKLGELEALFLIFGL